MINVMGKLQQVREDGGVGSGVWIAEVRGHLTEDTFEQRLEGGE